MPQPRKHLVIVAGEESGDLHAAVLIRQLKQNDPDLYISGIGGQHMQASGVVLIADLARYGVTGLTEVLRYFMIIRSAMKKIMSHLREKQPDVLLLVDYPGFNLRLARFAKKHVNLKIIYYISPQIWAWKANRIQLIKRTVDKMAVIFPFEKPLYEQANVDVSFVGHPLASIANTIQDPKVLRQRMGIPLEAKVIALLPGSRKHEIEKHLPVLKQTISLLKLALPDIHFVIPVASTIQLTTIESYFLEENTRPFIIQGQARECMQLADFVIVASGTASLESALLAKPMCIIYKASMLTYIAAKQLIKIKFLGLCNILSGRLIVPEFIQYDCKALALAHYVVEMFQDPSKMEDMTQNLRLLREGLSLESADCSLFDLVRLALE
jgi:lipid-A-disaccharide synthase